MYVFAMNFVLPLPSLGTEVATAAGDAADNDHKDKAGKRDENNNH